VPLDLLVLAIIAGFILYRLYLILGQRTGYDGSDQEESNIISLDAEREKHHMKDSTKSQIEEIPPFIRPGIQEITKVDPEFSLKSFMEGATAAFEIIIGNYAKGNLKKIERLLSPELFTEFKAALEERQQQGHTLENTLIRIENVDVQEAQVVRNVARLKVKFTSEQVPVVKDKNGTIVEGNPNK